MVTVSTAAATAAAAAAAELPLNGLLALNSRHLAPRTVIILDMGIFGFFLAISGLRERREDEGGPPFLSHLRGVASPVVLARPVGARRGQSETRAHPNIFLTSGGFHSGCRPETGLQQAIPHRRTQTGPSNEKVLTPSPSQVRGYSDNPHPLRSLGCLSVPLPSIKHNPHGDPATAAPGPPEELAEGFVVGQCVVVILRKQVVHIVKPPLSHELS